MRDRIRQLQKLAAALEPDAGERSRLLSKVVQYSDEFVEKLPRLPGFLATEDQGIGLLDSPISDDPISMDEALKLLRHHVDRPGVNVGSPGYLAYIPGSGLYVSALGDYLAAVTNRYAGMFFASPGAVRMERMLLRWMADMIGYPETSAGDLTSGGSIANLAGIVTARESCNLKGKDYSRAVVYLTTQSHHSVEKALRIAGLGECAKRYVTLDEGYRMKPAALEELILSDTKAGLSPWLIVASAGTTDTGAVDPLASIADLARAHGLWLHVDGAYGAMFSLCEPGREILIGIEESDSIVLDPHKGLFIPLGTGAVLVKDGRKLHQAHRYHADYLQDKEALASADEVSPADLSPELTRPFRGLRLWLALKLAGVAPFRAALEEKLLLARYFYEEVQKLDGFVVGPPPDLSVVTFRCVPGRGDVGEFNKRLVNAVQQDGRVFLSSTVIDGEFTLRFAVLGFRAHLEIVDLAIEVLREKAKELLDSWS
jgi:glutamate/tyrosine decarboxylase-like PLP-dependent enzyme